MRPERGPVFASNPIADLVQPDRCPKMVHEIAKLLLEHADTVLARKEAIKAAIRLGMPLHEIEEYLDWLDSVRPQLHKGDTPENGNSKNSGQEP